MMLMENTMLRCCLVVEHAQTELYPIDGHSTDVGSCRIGITPRFFMFQESTRPTAKKKVYNAWPQHFLNGSV